METAESVRTRHDPLGCCVYEVDGRLRAPEDLRTRTMNFGQSWRTPGVRDVDYRIQLPVSWLIEVCERDWADFVEDMRRFPDDDPLDRRLKTLGWVDPTEAFKDVEAAQLLCRLMASEALCYWLGDGPPLDSDGFVLNTVRDIEIEGDHVVFSGKARRNDLRSYAYQDV